MPFESHHFERNPFATRYVRPGVVEFRFLNGINPTLLVDRLRENHWTGEIVGPHGSGKSTLLQSLIPLIEQAGREVKAFTLHLGESQLPISLDEAEQWHEATQLVIDGYEQLSTKSRSRIEKLCRARNFLNLGLLVTSHAPMGLPIIHSTTVTIELVQSLVRSLQDGGPVRVHDADVAMSFERHQGNVRDVFFELYDIFEQRRPLECGDVTPLS